MVRLLETLLSADQEEDLLDVADPWHPLGVRRPPQGGNLLLSLESRKVLRRSWVAQG